MNNGISVFEATGSIHKGTDGHVLFTVRDFKDLNTYCVFCPHYARPYHLGLYEYIQCTHVCTVMKLPNDALLAVCPCHKMT